jgi:uncharacterized protein (UPF0332 family)
MNNNGDSDIQLDEELGNKIFQQTRDLWVLPEIKKREEEGLINTPIDLIAVQVLFYPDDRKIEVRINNEVKGIAMVKLNDGSMPQKGDSIYEYQIGDMTKFKLSDEDDGDCGHITMLKVQSVWTLFFDTRYNKDLSEKHLDRAEEFINVASYALNENLLSSFIENLFSACELIAKSILLITPQKGLRERSTHKMIRSHFNYNYKLGNVKRKHNDLLEELRNYRRDARYLRGDFSLDENKTKEMLETANDMLDFARKQIEI